MDAIIIKRLRVVILCIIVNVVVDIKDDKWGEEDIDILAQNNMRYLVE